MSASDNILLPYQLAWIDEPAQVAVAEKGRRIGLSWADASQSVLHSSAAPAHQGGQGGNTYYQSFNQEMTKSYIQDCVWWAEKYGLACSDITETLISNEREQVLQYSITFDSGFFIQALPSSPRVLRSKGRPGDRYVLDEAAFCDDLDELLKAATAMTQWGGSVRIISTHNGDDSEFNALVNDVRAHRLPGYALHRITLDDAIEQGLAERVYQVTRQAWHDGAAADWRAKCVGLYKDTDAANEELFCIPRQSGGVYLSRILIESRMADVPVLRFNGSADFNQNPEPVRHAHMLDWLIENLQPVLDTLTPELRHGFGMDFARSGDLSVIAPMEIGTTLHRRCSFLLEMHNVPHLQQVQALKYIGDRLPRLSAGAIDAGGNGLFIAEWAADEYGSLVQQVTFTEA